MLMSRQKIFAIIKKNLNLVMYIIVLNCSTIGIIKMVEFINDEIHFKVHKWVTLPFFFFFNASEANNSSDLDWFFM